MNTGSPSSEPRDEEVVRTELRPGLVMVRRRTLKPDGRYLLYYEFERDGACRPQEAE